MTGRNVGEDRKERSRKSQRKEEFGRHREGHHGKHREAKTEGSGISKSKGREKMERQNGRETGEVWENRGEGKEVGNVTGASGWQG